MDFKQLQTFVQVAELGSFTRAASVLRVAQPALSRQVRALEVELRQALFERNGRGVTLTPAGTRLLGHGRGILQQLERARQDLEEHRGMAAGLLSIGLPPSVSRTLTAPLVELFRERFPRATLTVVEGLTTYTLEWLAQGRIDCAVVYNATPAAAFELLPVLEEPLYLVSARTPREAGAALVARPLDLATLATRELAMPSRPHAIRMRLETVMAEAGLKPRVGLEIESVPAILDLVQRHPLHAVLSLNAIRASGRENELRARPVQLPARRGAVASELAATLWLATSAQRPRGPLLEQALPMLSTLLTEHLA
ncbi:LysR family transcriptional regulator [beta proteobacterium AAP121]|nr:LysR family transcriptional regulator [beta proteobacterium AAP65]KPF93037.1 LysR family transcriptional regulator [beta proteobacterium AAP121]